MLVHGRRTGTGGERHRPVVSRAINHSVWGFDMIVDVLKHARSTAEDREVKDVSENLCQLVSTVSQDPGPAHHLVQLLLDGLIVTQAAGVLLLQRFGLRHCLVVVQRSRSAASLFTG